MNIHKSGSHQSCLFCCCCCAVVVGGGLLLLFGGGVFFYFFIIGFCFVGSGVLLLLLFVCWFV